MSSYNNCSTPICELCNLLSAKCCLQSEFCFRDIQAADKHLDSNKKLQANRNRVLYLVNKGTLAWMQQDYTLANTYFNEADLFIEDQRKNWGSEALAIVSNPSVKPYKPEDFENVLINYYKAISYLQLGKNDEALVECRRVNEALCSKRQIPSQSQK